MCTIGQSPQLRMTNFLCNKRLKIISSDSHEGARMKATIFAFLGLVALTACGPNSNDSDTSLVNASGVRSIKGIDETQLFLGKYSGKFVENDFHESLFIVADGSLIRIKKRQVGGGSDSQVPYPTVCSYVKTGKITLVERRDMADRQRYMDFATHVFEVQYNDIALTNELEASTTSNPHCQTFLAEMKSMIAQRGSVQYSYYSELLSDESFRIHTSGGGDYQHGGPRTPSTLDEVYTKAN